MERQTKYLSRDSFYSSACCFLPSMSPTRFRGSPIVLSWGSPWPPQLHESRRNDPGLYRHLALVDGTFQGSGGMRRRQEHPRNFHFHRVPGRAGKERNQVPKPALGLCRMPPSAESTAQVRCPVCILPLVRMRLANTPMR